VDRVDELTSEVFNTVIALRHLEQGSGGDAERLQREVKKEIDQMMRRGPTLGIAHSDTQDMAYAIVGLVDEMALRAPAEISEYWMENLLQMHYFDENVAGEAFFTRMEEAQREQRFEVVRIYYICLLLGFRGRYAMRGGELELQDITSSIASDLAREGYSEDEPLAPSGERPDEPLTRKPKTLRLFWIPVAAVGLAAALYLGLSLSVASKASSLNEYIETLIK